MTVSLLRSFRLRGRSDGAVSHQQRLWRVNESVTTAEQGDGFSLALFGRNPTNNHLLNVPNFTR